MFVNISTVADISSTATYKLISSWSLWPLAVDPTQPDLQLRAQSNNDTPLEFQFRQSDESGKFNLCSAVGGSTYCLDVFNEPKDLPHLTPWGYYSGQYWSVQPSGGSVKLSNDWTGPGWFLDVYQGSLAAHLSQGQDYAGQYWMLDRVAENVTLPPDAPDIGTTTTLAPSDAPKSGGDQLSTPAIIGISLGGGIFSAAFLLAVLALMFRRRRRRLKGIRQQDATIAAGECPTNNRDHFTRTPDSRTGLDPSSNLTPVAGGPTSPQQAHFNGLPPELESPMTMRHANVSPHHGGTSYFPNTQQRSIYELPAEDQITPVMHPKPSYSSLNHPHHQPLNPDEKDPALFNTTTYTTTTTAAHSWPTSPASSTVTGSRGTLRPGARWEEVVPDGNGEITFTALTGGPPRSTSSPPPHPATANGSTGSVPTAVAHFPRNIAGIAYGFGGGGGMAGGAAPGYMGTGVAARDGWGNGTWSSDGRGTTDSYATTQDGNSPGGAANVSELDAHPPGYEGWPIYEVDGGARDHVHEAGGREIIRLADTPGPGVQREIVRLADLAPSPEREVVRLVDLPPSPERERGGGGDQRDWPAVGSMRR